MPHDLLALVLVAVRLLAGIAAIAFCVAAARADRALKRAWDEDRARHDHA